MIQRIQTVYYLIAVVLLVLVSFGQEIVAFTISGSELNEKIDMNVSSKGIHASATLDLTTEELKEFEKHIIETGAQFSIEESRIMWSNAIPVYVLFLAVMSLLVLAVFSFKNQKRQLRLGRIAFILNLLITAGLFILIVLIPSQLGETASNFMTSESIETKRSLGLGFYLVCASIPFIFLGNLGVRKDLDLLKSLDRLR